MFQTTDWTCSCTSIAWALTASGQPASEAEVAYEMGPERVNSSVGLTDASGEGIVTYLAELGISAQNDADASWEEVIAAAGFQPMVIGGRNWYHWVAVRMGPYGLPGIWLSGLYLMNPAPGWMGVENWLDQQTFQSLGPFSAVWWPA
jgi:hypothetical protein